MAPITRQSRRRRIVQIEGDHQKRRSLHRKFLRPDLSKDQSPENRMKQTKDQAPHAHMSSGEHTVAGRDFFELPAEFRNMVYSSACGEAAPLLLDFLEPAPWMLASKQILHESTPIFLRSNVFRTLICCNTDYDDMSMAARQQPTHSSTHVSSRTLEWLDGALCTNAPLIRDIGFAFADDLHSRDCFFRLSYRDDKPILSHGHCIMCDDEGFDAHVQPYDMSHPALSPIELGKSRRLASRCDAYHRGKRRHDEELQQWGTWLESSNVSHLGLSLQDIEEIARALRNRYVAPYVAQANDGLRLYRPETKLMSTVMISYLAYQTVAQIKRLLEQWDQRQEDAKPLRLRLDNMGRYETY